jgi:group I intron endonuclease
MCQFRLSASLVGYLLLFFFCEALQFDSLNSFCLLSLVPIVPIKSYSNAEAYKATILSENKNKAGIYMFKNLINGKRYVGSSENLARRFREYFNTNYLLRNTCMYIYRALLKHGYTNFSLTILEYCEPYKCLEREKYYLDLFKEKKKYNISLDPSAPMSGRQHFEESKQKISDSMIGLKHSDETKQIMSDAKKGENNPMYGKPKVVGSGSPSQQIEVTDIKNNQTTTYDSINEAARALNIHPARIVMYFSRNQKKPYKGQYTLKKI